VTGVETTTSRRATEQVRQAVGTVAGVANEVTSRLPEAATTTRDAIEEANQIMRARSDESLTIDSPVDWDAAERILARRG